MVQWGKRTCSCRLPENEASGLLFEDSGFLGRHIIDLYRFMQFLERFVDLSAHRFAEGGSSA